VAGGELAKVTAAVKAKDASITISSVPKDPDSSDDAFGTSNGNHIEYEASAHLSTFTVSPGGPGRLHYAEEAAARGALPRLPYRSRTVDSAPRPTRALTTAGDLASKTVRSQARLHLGAAGTQVTSRRRVTMMPIAPKTTV
jgi:hypothetical protein